MKFKFCSLASGSSGNCFYFGTDNYGFLIDAGIGARTIKKRLNEIGVDVGTLRALFITHDHIDHIKGAATVSSKWFLPVYATRQIHNGIHQNHRFTENIAEENKRYIEKNEIVKIHDFNIEAFNVPHDGSDNVGYTITFDNRRFTLATDLGRITTEAEKQIAQANYLVIEANYDDEMLRNGVYPEDLQKRIRGDYGHLSNAQTAIFLGKNTNTKLKNIWLCHLSAQNNTPHLAYTAVANELERSGHAVGKDINLYVLPRQEHTELFIL